MVDLWTTLIPIAIATAIQPIEVGITVLLLHSTGGRAKAAAWIAGMTLVRLVQYAVFGVVLERAIEEEAQKPSAIEGALLLVVAVLLLVSAARKVADQPDEDAPPPRWMTAPQGVTPDRAFLLGAGLVALSPKLWAFTLGAIGAIAEADAGIAAGWVTFIVWVVLAESTHLAALVAVVVAPVRGERLLARTVKLLEQNSRPLVIGIGIVFGVWFLLKALRAFGLLGT